MRTRVEVLHINRVRESSCPLQAFLSGTAIPDRVSFFGNYFNNRAALSERSFAFWKALQNLLHD